MLLDVFLLQLAVCLAVCDRRPGAIWSYTIVKDLHGFCKKITRQKESDSALSCSEAVPSLELAVCETGGSNSRNHRMVEAGRSFGPTSLLTQGPLELITQYCIQMVSE